MSLPLALGMYEPWAPEGPYLLADPELRARWRERLGPRTVFRAGLVWAGSPAHREDFRRSIDFARLQPIFEVPGIAWYRLQKERAREPAEPSPLLDFTAHFTDLAETAALLAELDLIVCVDTAVAHLAGALGRPTWLLLPHVPDWRWGLTGETTPWYPTMRIFRQPEAGDWEGAIAQVAEALRVTAHAAP
jgi:hypothetical protein